MDQTIDYYNLNAENFIENTQNVDMHLPQDKFLHLLNEGAAILDFGCGSGRDTKYFLDQGYQVTATDGSAELCRLARVCLKIHSRDLYAPLCGIFAPHSVNVARYASLI